MSCSHRSVCACCVGHRDCPSSIELLEPAEGAVPGDRVFIDSVSDGVRTDTVELLNPKKKIWDKLQVRTCVIV